MNDNVIESNKKIIRMFLKLRSQADRLINKEIEKLGYERVEFFNDGVAENNAYLFSKSNNKFLILNIRYSSNRLFYFFESKNIQKFFQHETTDFLPDWDKDDANLLALQNKIKDCSYTDIIRLELIIDAFDERAFWRITDTEKKEDEALAFIEILEHAIAISQKLDDIKYDIDK